MTPDKKIAALYVGDPCALLNTLAEKTRKLYGFKLTRTWDIVVASCGGAPKDICLYQAQKALDSARRCAGEHGRILLLAECAQGIGDERYENYVSRFTDHKSLLQDFMQQNSRWARTRLFCFHAWRHSTNLCCIQNSQKLTRAAACCAKQTRRQRLTHGWQ
ncbi:hypothetical protein [Desulfovibrio sp.]|uniref:hypothetical protein n=1 Tax=Desulfovibrio sp. TaxID=885 RepID=UPI0039B74135